jgi:serine protease Do
MMRLAAALLLGAAVTVPAYAQGAATDTTILGPQEIGTIRVGQTRNGVLEAGDWTMADGTWADVWYVEANAGQRLVVELRSRRFDAYLQLLDPWGNKLAEDDDSAGNGDARITYAVREPGRYQVVVNNFGDTPRGGSYSLSFH